jgi:ADP-heptose:LPS heptosyltransferase
LAKQHLLVFRFSSLGDVAMTVPVIRLLLQQHPELEVTIVSTEFVRPLFKGIERLQFHAADLKGKHKGVPGLFKLFRELKRAYRFDGIADLHNVLRTKILRSFFSLSGKPIAVIDKGREEKKELTRQVNKKLRPLKSTFQRYADVFGKLGFEVILEEKEKEKEREAIPVEMTQLRKEGFHLIGIAPFALHAEKTYPAEKMKEVIRLLTQQNNYRIYLFGGKKEKEVLEQWQSSFTNLTSLAGKMSFEKELQFISGLDVMVSMDSANMHLASLSGVPVVSIWGGTHPYLGFYGWQQPMENAVQVDLDCRPSSVFGNKPCPRNMECMNLISPLMVYEKIIQQLNRQL